jgi:hypothetical protein
MPKARKKPVEIEYVQWTGKNINEVFSLTNAELVENDFMSDELVIQTLEGDMRANKGDYIIKGVKGELYPCKPDVFEATYDFPI